MPFYNITVRELWREKSIYDLLYHIQADTEEAAREAVFEDEPVGIPELVDRDINSSEFVKIVSVEETGPFQTGALVLTSDRRAKLGRKAVEASTDALCDFDVVEDEAVREYAADAIANVLHAVRRAGYDTDLTLRRATEHFDAEVSDGDTPA